MYYVKEKTNFCRNCLQAFSTEEISKYHINDYFKINFKQIIQKSKEENKNMEEKSNERKIKRPCKVYADIESILVPQDKKRNIQMNLITKRAKNKNMMLAVMAIN